eukprot:GHVT01010554.1.p3 GENE.GHVT01010554.1~~GHVT01010554.1.p3  ORF type:complete len:102 (+),score=8.65 GHVT01010554.1:1319-1624(+)
MQFTEGTPPTILPTHSAAGPAPASITCCVMDVADNAVYAANKPKVKIANMAASRDARRFSMYSRIKFPKYGAYKCRHTLQNKLQIRQTARSTQDALSTTRQ